jgi:4-diphosphocytidyl-2-C-methyl-D-erythritol kinase
VVGRLERVVRLEKAYAKINLTLEVIGKRSDGYHEIASVVQTILLSDTLRFQAGEHVRLTCNVPQLVSPHNLVLETVKLLRSVGGSSPGVSVFLEKGIPLASGLGGGSSDAAATLRAVDEVCGLGLGHEKLERLAARLGSDVSFFLSGGATALVEGRGERVTGLPSLSKAWVVLVRPPVEIANKTREMYAGVGHSHYTRGEHTRRMVEAIKAGGGIAADLCYNVFDDIGFSSLDVLEQYRERFLAAGASHVHLAGSGPALFTLVEDRCEGEEIYRRLTEQKVETYLVETA